MALRALAAAFLAAAALVLLALTTSPTPAYSYSSGAPPMFSGPENYCNACHSDGGDVSTNPLNSGTGAITVEAPSTFMAGETITLTIRVTNTSELMGPELKQGFEASIRDQSDAVVGTFGVDGTTVQLAQGTEGYTTHTSASNTDTTWTFTWTAPATDAPETATLYAAVNAGNGNGFPDAGDKVYTAEQTLTLTTVANEPDATPQAFRLDAPYPNPVRDAATVRFALDRSSDVTVRLRDSRGRVVGVLAEGPRAAGAHTLRLEAADLAAGTYFLTLSTPEGTAVQRVTVAR